MLHTRTLSNSMQAGSLRTASVRRCQKSLRRYSTCSVTQAKMPLRSRRRGAMFRKANGSRPTDSSLRKAKKSAWSKMRSSSR